MKFNSIQWDFESSCLLSDSLIAPLFSLTELLSMAQVPVEYLAVYTPSLTLADLNSVLKKFEISAIILRHGSLIDHVAGLLNSRRIQLVIAPNFEEPKFGSYIFIDGVNERITVLKNNWRHFDIELPKMKCHEDEEIKRIEPIPDIVVNVDGSTPEDLAQGIKMGATGVGIIRSEWLSWDKEEYPSKQAHLDHLRCSAKAINGCRLNIRLFDIGGDKLPRWCSGAKEVVRSPLGHRGIRAIKHFKAAFDEQLKAVATFAESNEIGIVVPMVTDVYDLHLVREKLSSIANPAQLINISLGAMIEIPSAALTIEELLNEADFVRIGPGDLSQFTLGRLRKDISASEMSGSNFCKPVLHLIKRIVEAALSANSEVSICLDLEPRPSLLHSLLDVGLRSFSTSSHGITRLWYALHEVYDSKP